MIIWFCTKRQYPICLKLHEKAVPDMSKITRKGSIFFSCMIIKMCYYISRSSLCQSYAGLMG